MQQKARDEEILSEQIQLLLHRESKYILSPNTTKSRRPPLQHVRFRQNILHWSHGIIDHLQYNQEIVAISMDFVDRFLLLYECQNGISSRIYQLVAMSSLFLAIKLHTSQDKDAEGVLCLQKYASLSRGEFLPQDIIRMERSISCTLGWKLDPVSPMCFVRYFLKLVNYVNIDTNMKHLTVQNKITVSHEIDLVMDVLYELAHYFAEVAISIPEITPHFQFDSLGTSSMNCSTFTPSTVAYASILLSMSSISYSALPSFVRKSFLQSCTNLATYDSLILHPDRRDIQALQCIIKKAYQPEVLCERLHINDGKVHPLTDAMHKHIPHSTFIEGLFSEKND